MQRAAIDILAFPIGCLPFLSDDGFWNQNPVLSQDDYDHNVVMHT